MRECRVHRKLLLRIQCLQEENFQPPASVVLYFRAFLKIQEKYIQQGIFEVKETVYYIGKASHTARKTLITPKGQVYLAKKVSSGYKG